MELLVVKETSKLAHFIASLAGEKKLFVFDEKDKVRYIRLLPYKLKEIEKYLDNSIKAGFVHKVIADGMSINFIRKETGEWIRSLTKKERRALKQ